MSSTSSVGSSTSSSNNSSSSSVSAALNITPSQFLQLITTQMQDQNPLQPSDPTQFLTQLEQMSEVSSMQSMQSSLSGLQDTLASNQMANGAALIGQTVLAPTSTATLDSSGGTVTGAVAAPSGAKLVTVTVKDSAGTLVDSFQVTPAASGMTNFTWDGTNTAGTAAAAGAYTISATSSDGSSNTTLTPYIASKVQSVVLDSSTSQLDVTTENGTVALSNVVSITGGN
ncbi:MAG TPA: FlgD immunoglobulin-like domain containing protein [Steroidobacteraceae bacterium]|nr:FlgD immunoglobulin-like domain containing protein [Steroidobacteraceae bacterium]